MSPRISLTLMGPAWYTAPTNCNSALDSYKWGLWNAVNRDPQEGTRVKNLASDVT